MKKWPVTEGGEEKKDTGDDWNRKRRVRCSDPFRVKVLPREDELNMLSRKKFDSIPVARGWLD